MRRQHGLSAAEWQPVGYLFIAPALLLFLVFIFLPLFA